MNEWRVKENQPAVEGGDTVLVSANLKSITEAGKVAADPAPPAADPEPAPAEPTEEPTAENGED